MAPLSVSSGIRYEEIPLPNKEYTIPGTGHTYAYIYHPAQPVEEGSGKKKATLLWLHGFPSTSAGESPFLSLSHTVRQSHSHFLFIFSESIPSCRTKLISHFL